MKIVEKIKSMKGSEIVQAMVDGLEAEHFSVHMDYYLHRKGGKCFGCAATNAIAEIGGCWYSSRMRNELLNDIHWEIGDSSALALFSDESDFISHFERAVDYLRTGDIEEYNHLAKEGDFALLEPPGSELLGLHNHNWRDRLGAYRDYADWLRKRESEAELAGA